MFVNGILNYISVITASFGVINACVPLLQPITERAVNTLAHIQCDISNNDPCSNIITKMAWEKKYGDQDVWDEAATIDLSSNVIYYPLKDDHTLAGRSDVHQGSDIYDTFIPKSEVMDSGMWRCKVIDINNEEYVSTGKELVVTKILATSDISFMKNPSDHFVITTPYTYACISYNVYPEIDVTWEVNGVAQSDNIVNRNRLNGYLWTIESVLTLTWDTPTSLTVRCIYTKSDGITWTEENMMTPSPTQYPAFIEDAKLSSNQVELSSEFEIFCLASGNNIQITWKLDGSPLDSTLFTHQSNIVNGAFKYGQATALNDTLKWIPPKSTDTCTDIAAHQGIYTCEALGLANTVDTRDLDEVFVLHPPCRDDEETTANYDAETGKPLEFDCPCKPDPQIKSYLWTFGVQAIREGIEGQNTRTLSIGSVSKEDFDSKFNCNATNDYGSGKFSVQLNARVNSLSGGEIAGIVIGVIAAIALIVVISFLIKKNIFDKKKTSNSPPENKTKSPGQNMQVVDNENKHYTHEPTNGRR